MARPERPDADENQGLTSAIVSMLRAERERGEFPGASWCVVHGGRIVSKGAIGFSTLEPDRVAASPDTIYDLASLTKPLVTTTLSLLSARDGRIALDQPIAAVLPELRSRPELAGSTWIDLLSHRAGFEAWYPLYVDGRDRDSYLRTILSRPLAYSPRSNMVYSDLGFVLLFLALERLWAEGFEELARNKVFEPLGALECVFHPDERIRSLVAATEVGNEKEKEMVASRGLSFSNWRDGLIRGEVNDGNSWYLGGTAGNAGLFSDAERVALLASVYLGGRGFLPDELRFLATERQAEGNGEVRGLGWQLRSGSMNLAAPLSPASFGHTGFTGTAVWVDPVADLVIVLLTNRIHPRVRVSRIQEIRRRMNEIVASVYL